MSLPACDSFSSPYAYLLATDAGRRLREITREIEADQRAAVLLNHADIVCTSDASIHQNQKCKLKLYEFYWSVQRQSGQEFDARTLTYSRKADAIAWLDFPDDPDLPQVREALANQERVQVLRYVPQRRLTVRLSSPNGTNVIGKFKRSGRIDDAIHKLKLVNQLAAAAELPFEVPAFLGADMDRQMFRQSLCAGQSLASVMTRATAPDLLTHAAQVLAHLHKLPAEGLEHESNSAVLKEAQSAADWMSLLLSEHGEDLRHCVTTLSAYIPPDGDPVFCHGDFVCSQMLVDPARWSLLDFDLCRSGSRYRDLAILLASLPSDAGCFSAAMMDDPSLMAAESGFIAAYAAQSGLTINHQALTWHRICAELHYMMLMLKKNRFTQARFAGGLRRLRLLCTGLDRVTS